MIIFPYSQIIQTSHIFITHTLLPYSVPTGGGSYQSMALCVVYMSVVQLQPLIIHIDLLGTMQGFQLGNENDLQ